MPRSNSPLALSVVKVTLPGDVAGTLAKMMSFDNLNLPFNHNFTAAVMPIALRGVFHPGSVAAMLANKHPRVIKCVEALSELGRANPLDTKAFADFPDAGIRPVSSILWGPDVTVRVKASCWYINELSQPIIPLLQPRKECLSDEQLAVLVRLGYQAFCKGDWASAGIEIIDLSGDDKPSVSAKILHVGRLPEVSEELMLDYVKTYMAAKKLLGESKSVRPPSRRDSGMDDLFEPKRP